jgi:hypothetical protein
MKMETLTSVKAVRRAVFTGLLLWPMLIHAQSTDGTVDDPEVMAYDRFGHAIDMHDLAIPGEVNSFMGGGGPNSCTAGWFNLVFTDNNAGFNDPTWGATYRDIACRVFSDLSVLIVPANDPYTLLPPAQGLVNIECVCPRTPPLERWAWVPLFTVR